MTIQHRSEPCLVEFLDSPKLPFFGSRRVLTLIDQNVANLWPNLFETPSREIPAGEQSKSLVEFGRTLEWLAEQGATRDSLLVGIGGGVVGDLVGFVAGTYMRGIEFVNVPTTLMAMVDSSIGGKNGINLPHGKNLVGTFWPPIGIYIHPPLLRTLPHEEFSNGVAEIVKYGCIGAPEFFEDLELPLTSNSEWLHDLIRRSIEVKARFVEEDEFERKGIRAALNFGHTVAHAIEQVAGYGNVTHGFAVAVGMVAECRIGEKLGITPPGITLAVERVLQIQGLSTKLARTLAPEDLLRAMRLDKKATSQGLAFSLLEDFGRCKLYDTIPEAEVLAVLSSA